MNLAGTLANLAFLRQRAQQADSPETLAEVGLEQRDILGPLVGRLSGVGVPGVEELLSLVEPVPIEVWIERGEPGLLLFEDDAYQLLRSQFQEVDAESPMGQRLLRAGHLEARPMGGKTVVLPEDGDLEQPTVGVLAPVPAPDGVGVASVSVPFEPQRAKGVANEIHELARVAGEASEVSVSECSEGFALRPDGWRLGCIRGTCKGKCLQVVVRGERGIDSFRCVCRSTMPRED